MRRRRGFTVLELLVVMSIAGVLMALAVPRFGAYRDRAAVRSATADIGSALANARQLAIVRRSTVALVIDTADGGITTRSLGRAELRHALGATYGVRVATNRDSVVYDPRGLGYGVSNLSIVVRRGSAVDTVVVSRLGRVRW